jgi:ubiquinone/menaquinone biosynthesis C-methylase UbiE
VITVLRSQRQNILENNDIKKRIHKMRKLNKFKLYLLFQILIGFYIFPNSSFSCIDHKNMRLDSYLDQISENQEEKSGIINIIKNNKSGSYLDIGSGRDTISYIINSLSNEKLSGVKLIAADLESKTLGEIAKHHPELCFNSDNSSDISLSLMKMDATEMHQLKDNSITAINASALLHEVNSYVPTKTPIDRFFDESIRILKKGGFLVYRDPTLQSNPESMNSLVIKKDFAKKFISLFLPKLLDTKLTQLTDMYGNSIKPNFQYKERVKVTLSLVGQTRPINLDYQEFFSIKSNDIDFSKDITIAAPRRLLSEIQRHYILFVKNVYPLAFVDDKLVNDNLPNHTPPRAKKVIHNFAKSLGVDYGNKLKKSDLLTLTNERKKIDDLINNGIKINNTNVIKSLHKLLESRDISPNLYKIEPESIWLDAKLFTILYNRLDNSFKAGGIPVESMIWLMREGEEFYFYYTIEELISYLHKFCNFFLKNTNKEGCLLSPVHIKHANRDVYLNLLERDMVQLDENSSKQEFITSKTIIVFQLIKPKKTSEHPTKVTDIKKPEIQDQLAQKNNKEI